MLYIFFFKFTVMATMKEPRVNIPSSPELYKELELVPAAAPCIHLPSQVVQMNLAKPFLVLRYSILVDGREFYLAVEQIAQLKGTGQGVEV